MRVNADAGILYYARHEGVWPAYWFYLDEYNPWCCDICLDEDGDPVIAFYAGEPRRQLMLARWNKSGGPPYLIVEEITPPGSGVGFWPSCRFDSEGALHIAHYENFALRPYHSVRQPGGSWQHEAVDVSGSGGYQPSLAFLNGTTPVIAYTTATPTTLDNSTVRLATRQSDGSWQREELPGKTMQGESLSLAVDSRGRPHLLRFDAPNFGVSLSVREGAAWVSERLLAGTGYGFRLRLVLDGNECPVVGVARREGFWVSYLYQGVRGTPFESANASKDEPLPLDPAVANQKLVIGPLNVGGSPGGAMPTSSPSNSGGKLPGWLSAPSGSLL
jgi:hypothetical protein